MAYPTWTTTSGSLGTLTSGQTLVLSSTIDTSIHITATNAASIKIISGELPPGLFLDYSAFGYIHGVVLDPGVTKTYSFTVRASNSFGVDDRLFNLTVVSIDQPVLRTPAGLLPAGFNDESYVINNSPVSFQFLATVNALSPGVKSLYFYIPDGGGTLPPGLALSPTGLLSGVVKDNLDIIGSSISGTYDRDPFDMQPYDIGNTSNPAVATSTINLAGEVSAINLTSGGYGYNIDPNIIIGGSVRSVTVSNTGQNYFSVPDVLFSDPPSGITATGKAVLNAGGVLSIQVLNPGAGYIDPPTVIIRSKDAGGGAIAYAVLYPGSGATALAHLQGGSVASIDITNKGSGYTSAPIVIFGNPSLGSKIIGKTYRFDVAVTNGQYTDIKTYSMLIDSQQQLRSDSTFIQSDSIIYQADSTFYQAPVWITKSDLGSIRGNTYVSIPIEVLDTTYKPPVGQITFSVLSTNLDLTNSQLGPINTDTGSTFLTIDPTTGLLYGQIPYQPVITQTYNFTIKAARVVDDVEEIASLRQFKFTLLGNINSAITWVYPTTTESPSLVGTLKPNEQSLLYVEAGTSLSNASINYTLSSGYGMQVTDYITGISFLDTHDQIFVKNEGTTRIANGYVKDLLLMKGMTFNIKINTPNHTVSIKQLNGLYYSKGLYHSDGTSGDLAQEKTSGFWIFHIPYDAPENLSLNYTSINKTGLIVSLKQYSTSVGQWIDQKILSFKDEYEASTYYAERIYSSTDLLFAIDSRVSPGMIVSGSGIAPGSKVKKVVHNVINGTSTLTVSPSITASNNQTITFTDFASSFTDSPVSISINTIAAGVNTAGERVKAAIIVPNTLSWAVKEYNNGWNTVVYDTVAAANPADGDYWLDLDSTSYGVYELAAGGWVAQSVTNYLTVPSNSIGTAYQYASVNILGTINVYRKEPTLGWTLVTVKNYLDRVGTDPTIFITSYNQQPVSLNTHDIWFKYNERARGEDLQAIISFATNGHLPTDLTLTSQGHIIGKVAGILDYTYRSVFKSGTFYSANDVIRYGLNLYISTTNHKSGNNFAADSQYWNPFVFDRTINLSFDTHLKGLNVTKFNTLTTTFDRYFRFRVKAFDSLNVSYSLRDFYIDYQTTSNVILTNIYLQPFFTQSNRILYRNFISDNSIFDFNNLYRPDDPAFGVQSIPKMLLLPGIQSTTADRYAGAVFRNFYNRNLIFGELKTAVAKDSNGQYLYDVIYVEIKDPSETVINGTQVTVASKVKLSYPYDTNITSDYSKIRVDEDDVLSNQTKLDTIYPSSIMNMQANLKQVKLTRVDSLNSSAVYDNWGSIIDPTLTYDNWGTLNDLVTFTEDFMVVLDQLQQDDAYRPLWMNTSQDNSGVPIGFTQAIPICYCKPNFGKIVLSKIIKNGFDFRALNFEIDRIIIEQVQGDTGAKYIKFANKDIV
jgi:hypothetical protein